MEYNQKQQREALAQQVKKHFPTIPANHFKKIIQRAKKSDVLASKRLTEKERIRRMLVAYVRHNLTDYDNLMRQATFGLTNGTAEHKEARIACRGIVNSKIARILKKWENVLQ
jgi:hypothetical protein